MWEGDKMNTPSDGINDAIRRTRTSLGRTSGPTRRSTKGQWTLEEDEILHQAVQRFKGKNWKKIAECFKDRTDVQCLHRWQKVLNPELVKGPWSKEEDEIIIQLVDKYGPKKWSTISQHLPGRIGKQCRERWHNHLNPGINKQAWTQEEELALIRAHQIYGNKWAELTKFLPGRTDNSIKNHWNSSVKKKLEQYLSSGLLQQFQGLPHNTPHPCQSNASSSVRVQQSSEEENIPKDSADVEEDSQCSQSSAVIGCSQQSTSDMHHTIAEESCNEKDLNSSPSCSGKYHLTPFQEVGFPISEVSGSMVNDWKINHSELTEPMVNLPGQESMGQYMQYLNAIDMSRSTRSFPFNVDGYSDSLLFQPSNYHIRENDTFGAQSCYLSNSDMLETSNSQQLPIIYDIDTNQLNYSLPGTHEQEESPFTHDDFINGNEFDSGTHTNDAPKLVAANDTSFAPSREIQSSVDKNTLIPPDDDEQKEFSSVLCYEPPRFPSLDIPFMSCDLLQPGTDMLQDYSPLGTRQFWTSLNRLWDSPTGDRSPDAVLKSAAKSYSRTPSILKKRTRDLVSPLSEKRSEKKFETTFSNLSKEFSRLDVMFDEVSNDKISKTSQLSKETRVSDEFTEDKENINPEDVKGKTEVGVENISIFNSFGDTPFKRSFESPSAWKSPWFVNSLSIEDYGHFLSPNNRSYDAIGLTKLLSEQTASAFANAQEVLGDETPQSLLKKKCSKNQTEDEISTSVMGERRMLDFSDCGTPEKGIEAGKSFCNSSPSSLFKDCR